LTTRAMTMFLQVGTSTPVVTDTQRIAAARAATWSPTTRPEDAPAEDELGASPPPLPPPAAEAPPVAGEEDVIEVSEEEFRGQVLDTISEVLRAPAPVASEPEPEPEIEIEIEPDPLWEVAESPLFSSFSEDELLALIDGLRLLSFEPGDVIVAEGDPGDSLFVLTTGLVKAFIRRPEGGAPRLVRRLSEGEFFGEISILSGKQRTATVTAATHCELLELDRPTLDRITESHPNVLQILEDFYIQRAST